MLRLRKWQGAAVVLACCGLLLPSQASFAAGKAPQPKPIDVALTKAGSLNGAVFSPEGKQIDGATVVVLKGDEVVAQTNTDEQGKFSAPKLKPGVYQVAVGQRAANIRVWSAQTAPPQAHQQAVLVTGTPVVRGQFNGFFGLDTITLVTVAAATTAAVLAGLNHNSINDLEDKVDRLLSP